MKIESFTDHSSNVKPLSNYAKFATLIAMCFALLMINIDDTVVNVALPQIQSGLNINLSRLQWILTANALPATSFVLSTGTLGDIYGHKRVFLWGLFAFTFGSLICGFAPGLEVLIMGRALQGLGDAALVQASLSILTDTFSDEKQRAKAIGIWTSVSGIALVTGPVLGGLLVDHLGWQSVFFMNLPLAGFTFWLTSSFVREVKIRHNQSIDVLGLLFSIVFLTSFIYGITEANHQIWQFLSIAGFSLVAFLVIEKRNHNPMLPLKLFQNLDFSIINIVSLLVFLTLIGLFFLFNLFLQQIQGYSAIEAGVRFLPFNGAFILGSLASGWFVSRLGWRFAIANGLMLMFIAMFSFIRVVADTEYVEILVSFIAYGFGVGLTIAPLSTFAMSSVPVNKAGIASAVHNTCGRIGWILGIALQGTILTQCLTANLQRSLLKWNLPSDVQDKIITQALHNLAEIKSDLPSHISPLVLHQETRNAFVSGLHLTLFVSCLALLLGIALILILVPSKIKQRSQI